MTASIWAAISGGTVCAGPPVSVDPGVPLGEMVDDGGLPSVDCVDAGVEIGGDVPTATPVGEGLSVVPAWPKHPGHALSAITSATAISPTTAPPAMNQASWRPLAGLAGGGVWIGWKGAGGGGGGGGA